MVERVKLDPQKLEAGISKTRRPCKYKPEYVAKVYKLALLGATDAQIADIFGVSTSSLYHWLQRFPEFREALSRGKDEADAEIAHSLYHRAKGYEHEAVKILTVSRGEGMGSEVEYHTYTERYPPDTNAAKHWLSNRQPGRWRERSNVELTGRDGGPIESVTITTVDPLEAARQYQRLVRGD